MIVKGFDSTSPTENLIAGSIVAKRFPHAVLIEGDSAERRLMLAEKIAAALICGNADAVPCGECRHCAKALRRTHPDIIYREPDSGTASPVYKVDSIRDTVDDSYILPNEADIKIYILSDADKMNIQSQNAFLKTLEEPPAHSMFILLCSSKEGFLPTILSRVTLFSLGEEVRAQPGEDAINAANAVALSLLDPVEYGIVAAAGVFEKNQKLLLETLPVIEEIFAAALRIKFDAGEETAPESARVLAGKLSRKALLNLIESTERISLALGRNANLNLTIVRLCTCFRSAVKEQE